MWITSVMARNLKSRRVAERALVTESKDAKVSLVADSKHKDVPVVAPYGLVYSPPVGVQAVMVPTVSGEVCAGVVMPAAQTLESGEVMLCSKGATLVLKNDGRVLVNGKELGGV